MLGKRDFVTDLISLGIQGISALLNHRKTKINYKKGMKTFVNETGSIK